MRDWEKVVMRIGTPTDIISSDYGALILLEIMILH